MQLSDSEAKVMDIIWDENYTDENGEITAKEVSDILIDKYGWQKTSNYVYFTRLLKKGFISRRYPNYTIKPEVHKEELAGKVVNELIDNTFNGSVYQFFTAFLKDQELSDDELTALKSALDNYRK